MSGLSQDPVTREHSISLQPEYLDYGLELARAIHMCNGEAFPIVKDAPDVRSWSTPEDKRNIQEFENEYRKSMGLSPRTNNHKICPWKSQEFARKSSASSLASSSSSDEELFFSEKYFHQHHPYHSKQEET